MVGGVDHSGNYGGLGCRNFSSSSRIFYDTMIAFTIGCIKVLWGWFWLKRNETKLKQDNGTMNFKHYSKAGVGGKNRIQKSGNSNMGKYWTCLALAYATSA